MANEKGMSCRISHSELVNASGIVHKGPCLITGFSVTGQGADGAADIYDGGNSSGVRKYTVRVLSNTSFSWSFAHPVDFDHGIYVYVAEATTFVSICYIPESRGDYR